MNKSLFHFAFKASHFAFAFGFFLSPRLWATPSISSVSPNPATGANSAQTLTAFGSGFVSPAQVKLSYPAVGVVAAGSQTFSASFISSTELQISPTYANDPVVVLNGARQNGSNNQARRLLIFVFGLCRVTADNDLFHVVLIF